MRFTVETVLIEGGKHFLAYLLEELHDILYICLYFFFQLQCRLGMAREGTQTCSPVADFVGQLLGGKFLASLNLGISWKRKESLDAADSPHWEEGGNKTFLFLSF